MRSTPVGADLTFSVYVGTPPATDPWITLTIATGTKSVHGVADQIDALTRIAANANVLIVFVYS